MDYYDGVILKPELSEEMLEHFGVKGMHWGVRHDERVKKRREKRIKKYETSKRYVKPKSKEEADRLILQRAARTGAINVAANAVGRAAISAGSGIVMNKAIKSANSNGISIDGKMKIGRLARSGATSVSGRTLLQQFGTAALLSAGINQIRYKKTGYVKII